MKLVEGELAQLKIRGNKYIMKIIGLSEKEQDEILWPEIGNLCSLEELQRRYINIVIANTRNKKEAAKILGIDYTTLRRKLIKWENEGLL